MHIAHMSLAFGTLFHMTRALYIVEPNITKFCDKMNTQTIYLTLQQLWIVCLRVKEKKNNMTQAIATNVQYHA